MTRLALLFVLAVGLAGFSSSTQQIQRVNPDGMMPHPAFHHLVRAGNLLFLAGQVAVDGSGELVGKGDMKAQLRQTLENIQKVLASQGADFSHVVKITTFTTDIESFLTASEIRQEYFKEHTPASTLVEVPSLARPEFLVEIETIAVLPE